jgi:hypothetical protein
MHSTNLLDHIQFDWRKLTPADFEEESQYGSVEITTSIEVTGELSPEAQAMTAHRLICLYTLSKMNAQALTQASQTLVDIYAWQVAQDNLPPKQAPERRVLRSPKIKQRPSASFKIEET